MRKIEIGGGTIPNGEYEQLDIIPGPGIDIVCDATKLGEVYPGEFDEIYCRNVIEHFSYLRTVDILHSWWLALKPGGILICDTPLLLGMIDDYIEGKNNFEQLVNRIYGSHTTDFDYHKAGFDKNTIVGCFNNAGFVDVTTQTINKYSLIVKGKKP